MNILETKGLFHDFSGLQVLSDVNLQIRDGERHAVIGPNGAGKTTLFNVVTGTYAPSRGQVFFKGRDVTGLAPNVLVIWKERPMPMRDSSLGGRPVTSRPLKNT